MPRGGKRPGAGAPRGNMNNLKHGRYSRQFAQVGALLASDPTVRAALLEIGKRHELKQRKANEVAALLLTMLFERAHKEARDGLNLELPVDDWDSNRAVAHDLSGGKHGNLPAEAYRSENNATSPGVNQTPGTDAEGQSPGREES